MTIAIALIAAVAENGVIGHDNVMPWKVSSDLKRFKALTMGKPIVMGRKTYQSIGRPLPGRPNVVVTRDPSFSADGIHVVASLDTALDLARSLAVEAGVNEVMVMGGGEIYRQAIAVARKLYITRIHDEPRGDVRFPDIEPAVWREVSREDIPRGERDSAGTRFLVYERI